MASIGECSIGHSREHQQNNNQQPKLNDQQDQLMRSRLIKLLSIMYALLLIVVGAIITIGDMEKVTNDRDHLYSIFITAIGIAFLLFIHVDVQRHKRFVLRWQQRRKELIESPLLKSNNDKNDNDDDNNNNGNTALNMDLNVDNGIDGKDCDSVSVTTAVIFNRVYQMNDGQNRLVDMDDETRQTLNGYRFLTGKHSGSFFLKIGMTCKLIILIIIPCI